MVGGGESIFEKVFVVIEDHFKLEDQRCYTTEWTQLRSGAV